MNSIYFYVLLVVLVSVLLLLVAVGGGASSHGVYQRGNWFLTVDFPIVKIQREVSFNDRGQAQVNLSRRWFHLGSWVSVAIILPSVALLTTNLWKLSVKNGSKLLYGADVGMPVASTAPTLQVVVPGYNLPLSDLGYYAVTLFVITVLHEWGHAAAARAEGIQVLDYGVMFFGPVPMAFVNLPSKDLDASSFGSKLRVLTAGVWHNVVLVAAAWAVLASLPWVFAPLYQHGQGLTVTSVARGSVVAGPSGLAAGDLMTSLNGCRVDSVPGFRECMLQAMHEQTGWCAQRPDRLHDSLDECANRTTSHQQLCFNVTVAEADTVSFAGLDVRQVLEGADVCNSTKSCHPSLACLRPATENLTQIKREAARDFLFVGDPSSIYYDVQVTGYRSRIAQGLDGLPQVAEKLLYYFVILSSALAALNAVPCWRLDGCLTLEAMVNHMSGMSNKQKRRTIQFTTHLGTALLVLNLALGLLDLIL